MTVTNTLVIEIGTEELPPKALKKLSLAFESALVKRLTDKGLNFEQPCSFATPRRLAIKFPSIQTQQLDQTVERRGPAVSAAFDSDGEPTKAAMGFARSCGIDIAEVSRLKTDKGERLAYKAEVKGESLDSLLPKIISEALDALPIPKRMRWGAGNAEFVRPVHWLVMLLGDRVIEGEVLGIKADRFTFGHRFHSPERLTLTQANDYPDLLQRAHVIADFEQRKTRTIELTKICAKENSGVAIIDPALLDEVTALVEWPAPICGTFDAHFLQLPREVLIASMQDHQKYFPLENENGELINKFITIANIDSSDPGAIKSGNERVIRPRLGDAKFFWDQDLKTSLRSKKERLGSIVFEKQLGTLLEKTERVAAIAESIAENCRADANLASTAAELSRADLVSEMVGEFPELQGIMGGYYANHDAEDPEVQQALSQFYRPRFAGDDIPNRDLARCIAVADRLDTLTGIFAIGAAPTGDKDPYALRRAALGTIRILVEGEIPLDLETALNTATKLLAGKVSTDDIASKVLGFMMDRLRGYYAEKDYSQRAVESVLALHPASPFEVNQRLVAVIEFSKLSAAADLANANKRISNILRKAKIDDALPIDRDVMVEPAEKALDTALAAVRDEAQRLFDKNDYAGHLNVLASLKDPINTFFDDVMVMADDPKLKTNRLALLSNIRAQFSQVADISLLSE